DPARRFDANACARRYQHDTQVSDRHRGPQTAGGMERCDPLAVAFDRNHSAQSEGLDGHELRLLGRPDQLCRQPRRGRLSGIDGLLIRPAGLAWLFAFLGCGREVLGSRACDLRPGEADMRRREFISLLGGMALAAPGLAKAETPTK